MTKRIEKKRAKAAARRAIATGWVWLEVRADAMMPVRLLSFDGNKRCQVETQEGGVLTVHYGYLSLRPGPPGSLPKWMGRWVGWAVSAHGVLKHFETRKTWEIKWTLRL